MVINKILTLVGGCNGAGKSTYASRFMVDADYINPDALQAEQGVSPIEIGRFVINLVDNKLEGDKSFVLESTFSDQRGLNLFRKAKQSGWKTRLVFIGLDSPRLHKERVAIRVSRGGHHIADALIERRYPRALENFKSAVSIVDEVLVLGNSGDDYQEIALFKGGSISNRFQHYEAERYFAEYVRKLAGNLR
jgi:predicted ABC-type ATPase